MVSIQSGMALMIKDPIYKTINDGSVEIHFKNKPTEPLFWIEDYSVGVTFALMKGSLAYN